MGIEYMDWIHVVQNVDQWRTFMKTVMRYWVPCKQGIS